MDARKLQPGDRLPPERELARILQVGRSSLREATAVLASQGLLTVKRGHGIYVAEPAPAFNGTTVGADDLRQLFDMREIIEVAAAGWAAAGGSDEDIAALQATVEAIDVEATASPPDLERLQELDTDFHLLIAAIARNRFLHQMTHLLHQMLAAGMEATLQVPAGPAARVAATSGSRRRSPDTTRRRLGPRCCSTFARFGRRRSARLNAVSRGGCIRAVLAKPDQLRQPDFLGQHSDGLGSPRPDGGWYGRTVSSRCASSVTGSVTRGRPRSVSGMGSRGGSREDTAPSWVRHVVVPADSSPASLHGLALAADIARRTGARVTVVHVRHLPGGTSLSPASTRGPIAETLNEIEAEVRAAAAAVLESADVSWDLVVRSGSPGEQVLEAVKEGGGDLIIIGSKRHSSIHNVLLGSTSAYLAAHSPVPVLVARPQQETDNT